MNAVSRERPISIAILAIGGQGGGVLSDWLIALGERNGWYVQATSVPGVAQRTGATVYYLEMIPFAGRPPVLAMMPAPGDVDIVIAAEAMEAGRAIQRGLVTPDRTTLIASTHRAYAILEKAAPGDGRGDAAAVAGVARQKARRYVAADFQRLAEKNGSVISASLFGGLAGSGALPFPEEDFAAVVGEGGKGVEASLRAFAAGAEAARLAGAAPEPVAARPGRKARPPEPQPSGGSGREHREFERALERIKARLPAEAQEMARAGLRKVAEFQDAAYGHEYLDTLCDLLARDKAAGGGGEGFAFTREAAKYLANAMAYDDVIRVAELKTRSSRMARVQGEAGVRAADVLHVTEYMHPRAEEICGTLPAGLGGWVEARPRLVRTIDRLFNRGRQVRTDRLHWFLALYALSGLKPARRKLLRHRAEAAHWAAWLDRAKAALAADYRLGIEVIRCRRLIKGYSDTRSRGESKFDRVLSALPLLAGRPDAADWLRRLREAALKDEEGAMLDGALRTVASLDAPVAAGAAGPGGDG